MTCDAVQAVNRKAQSSRVWGIVAPSKPCNPIQDRLPPVAGYAIGKPEVRLDLGF